jgi:hypothetical protein
MTRPLRRIAIAGILVATAIFAACRSAQPPPVLAPTRPVAVARQR